MGSHMHSRQWPIHPFLAGDVRRSIYHPFTGPMGSHQYTADTDVEKEQDIENWLRGTTKWTGSVMVCCRNSSLWPNQLTLCLPSHLSFQVKLRRLRKQSRTAWRSLPDLSKNSNNPVLFIQLHAQPLVRLRHFPHPIMKPTVTMTNLSLTMEVVTAAANLRLSWCLNKNSVCRHFIYFVM